MEKGLCSFEVFVFVLHGFQIQSPYTVSESGLLLFLQRTCSNVTCVYGCPVLSSSSSGRLKTNASGDSPLEIVGIFLAMLCSC